MQTSEPRSLKSLVGTLSIEQVASILEQLLARLEELGRRERVHGCLAPDRVQIGEGDEVEITDPGSDTPSGRTITGPGARRNDAHYISPEAVMGRVVTPASDMYSIGCMAYEMLAGRPPFLEATPIALLMRHTHDSVPDVRALAPDVPEPVALWIARMTATDPQERYPGAGAAWQAFERALERTEG